MDKILAGVRQFSTEIYPKNEEFYRELAAKQQKPQAVFITCSDSRINPNLITQTEPGDLFIVRNAGNIVPSWSPSNSEVAATIEYAVAVLGIPNIIICGHSKCGAMTALLDDKPLDDLPAVRSWFAQAEATKRIAKQKYSHLDKEMRVQAATEENVLVQMNNLSTHPAVAAKLSIGEVKVFGWYYDIGSGQVMQYDQAAGEFRRLNGNAGPGITVQVRSVSPSVAALPAPRPALL